MSTKKTNDYFVVQGKARLEGEIVPQGAKNEALQIIAAVLLTEEAVVLRNVPNILDVKRLIELLRKLGVTVERMAHDTYRFKASYINPNFLTSPECQAMVRHLRGSFMIVGPLLARLGRVTIARPGGDKIGRRRMDTHLYGFQQLGASFGYDAATGLFTIEAPDGLRGRYMLLDEASVTGTGNIVMAAVLAQGTTTIYNAACEPYVQQLCRMLNRMGAKIEGIGSNLLTIRGVTTLQGTEHTLLADMIEVGSFIGLAAMTQSPIVIKQAGVEHLGLIPYTFERLGVKLEINDDNIFVPPQDLHTLETFIDGSILTISDHTWPGLTPDLLSVLLVVATQCKGTVLIHQKMFESRLFFVDKLIDMGAQIILCDPHRATVIGLARQHRLRGISMTSPDIRAGVAMLIAALSAEGTSTIYNVEQIDRGYEDIDIRLNALGAKIERKRS